MKKQLLIPLFATLLSLSAFGQAQDNVPGDGPDNNVIAAGSCANVMLGINVFFCEGHYVKRQPTEADTKSSTLQNAEELMYKAADDKCKELGLVSSPRISDPIYDVDDQPTDGDDEPAIYSRAGALFNCFIQD